MKKTDKQIAAIPFRFDARGRLEILLVTSRETQRWVIPKGWPWPQTANHKAAAGEAWEEAGVIGVARKGKIGTFEYDKRDRKGSTPVKVSVYLLEVTGLARTWPEFAERRRAWFRPDKAAAEVAEPGLKSLLQSLAGLLMARAEPQS